jgi:integrase
MSSQQTSGSPFEKVGECLYRYTPSGVYYARIKQNGKEIRQSLETDDRFLAKRKLAKMRKELAQIDLSAGKITVEELCTRYLKTVRHQKANTLEGKKSVIKHIREGWPHPTLAHQQVRDVKPSDVKTFLSTEGTRRGKSSFNQHVITLRAIFQLAVDDRIIAESPAAAVKQIKRDKPIRITPTFEEFNAIVADIRNQAFNADASDSGDFVEFIGLAGLGQAEAGSLTWGDIDMDKGVITTFRHKTSRGFNIPIYPQLRPLMEKLKGKTHHAPGEKVFKIKDAKKSLAGACRRLGMPNYTHRAFRRMFITRAIEKGIDVKVIAEWQGHRDGGKLILDTYSEVRRPHAARMAMLMTTEGSL